jgi:hypothetical protein
LDLVTEEERRRCPGAWAEEARWVAEDHVWFEDRWMVASWCDE